MIDVIVSGTLRFESAAGGKPVATLDENGAEMARSKIGDKGEGRMDRFFTDFSNGVAKWTGSHWTFTIVAILVIVSLAFVGVEMTNVAISIVTLLMVFVLQNTQNRDSAALHLKLDEIVRVEPDARDDVRGVESKSEPEIRELRRDDSYPISSGAGSDPGP